MAQREIRYQNRFIYIFIKPAGGNNILYCSGVNVLPFLPITKGRHKSMNNPVVRGLQLVNLDIRDMALLKGATPITYNGAGCQGIAPTTDVWYSEGLLIKDPPEGFGEEILDYAVVNLLKKMDKAIMLNASLPEKLLSPEELESFLEGLCRQYGSPTL